MTAALRSPKADQAAVDAVEVAREALADLVGADAVGEHVGHRVEAERVVSHMFATTRRGYRGWCWSVTLTRAARQKRVTVDEVVLVPGEGAIVAPAWLPWRDRVQPGDLSPGDVLPVEEDDPRLAPGYLAGDDQDRGGLSPGEDADADDGPMVSLVTREVGLGRSRVLSPEGRDQAAQRWYDGSHGPGAAIAQSAPAPCATCGFLVRMAGPLARVFGVCANANANDDGRVVSVDHGCGAHSQAQLKQRHRPQPLPEPVLDTVTWDEVEQF